jgi:hypothetical protein
MAVFQVPVWEYQMSGLQLGHVPAAPFVGLKYAQTNHGEYQTHALLYWAMPIEALTDAKPTAIISLVFI